MAPRDREAIHPYRWRALMVWIVIFTVSALWLYGDIEHSRRESCRRTYSALQKVINTAYGPVTSNKRIESSRRRVLRVADPARCDIISEPFWAEWGR